MKSYHTSSPSNPPICCVYMIMNEKKFISTWGALYAARHLIDEAILGHSYKLGREEFSNMPMLTTEDGLIIKSPHLDDILEYTLKGEEAQWSLPDQYRYQVNRLRDDRAPAVTPTKRERVVRDRTERPAAPAGYTPLADLCESLGVEPRDARAALRKSTYAKPAHGWSFPEADLDQVRKIIK